MLRIREEAVPPRKPLPIEPLSRPIAFDTSQLEFFNGYGGFGAAGREYVVVVNRDKPTPAPWINVVANPDFGFQVSAEGGGYTWFGNSRENQITPWRNDAVSDQPSEVIYIRDEADGTLMTPTHAPLRSPQGTHVARHGFGYSILQREVHQLRLEVVQLVPLSDSIKLSRLTISNTGTASRTLTVTYYVEWMIGAPGSNGSPHIVTWVDEQSGSLCARNPWKIHSGEQVAFLDMAGLQSNWTADRREFIGAHGRLAHPAGLTQGTVLSNRTGAGLDPCGVLQTRITLAAGESIDIVISLGAANSAASAQTLLHKYRETKFEDIFQSVQDYWRDTLTAVQVKTEDRSFDILMNGWLLYQTLACRMWARSGFYQASGAYGFRDQLQDSMSLLSTKPGLAREHILRAAARQFVEGDFQHWWLPATGMGVRTRISDDTVWLANCVAHYVKTTGDTGVLDEAVSFLEGQSLQPGEHDAFFQPVTSDHATSLYDHCKLALERSLAFGAHGLPLMGTGDWNDGMNRVGEGGKGESVWLGWFLLKTLADFMPYLDQRGDGQIVESWRHHIAALRTSLDTHAWDGQWYRRGFFDDGSALGSALNEECCIDAIAQSWAVLSGGGTLDRNVLAMDQSYARLVRPKDKLALLFTPPFDKTSQEPGYVKAYPPGIRENGGQYTHGVIWSIFGHAALGQHDRANEIFALINPINHALDGPDVNRYRVEPYVIAADVYSVPPHVGRGGWTWYTGSAGWMYRAGCEAILGITREANQLRVKPCIAQSWKGYEYQLQFGTSRYVVRVSRGQTKNDAARNGVNVVAPNEYVIDLVDDGEIHEVLLTITAA
jgi:cyclic beta-1,2-glucan synthetase